MPCPPMSSPPRQGDVMQLTGSAASGALAKTDGVYRARFDARVEAPSGGRDKWALKRARAMAPVRAPIPGDARVNRSSLPRLSGDAAVTTGRYRPQRPNRPTTSRQQKGQGLYANRPDRWAGICSTIGMRHRGELTDQEWERLEPLLPAEKPERGRPNVDHRRIINGIVWRERTGAPWRDLPERYGPWSTVYSRFWRWREAGIWDRLFAAIQQEEDAAGAVDWSVQFVDGTVIRAHQHAAGAKGGRPTPRHSGAARAASAPRCTSRPTARASH